MAELSRRGGQSEALGCGHSPAPWASRAQGLRGHAGRGGAGVPKPLLFLNKGPFRLAGSACYVASPRWRSGKCRDLGTWQGAVGLGQMKRGRCRASALQELGCHPVG